MYNLRKQLNLLLLSGLTIFLSSNSSADYVNAFLPIYVKGDDVSQAKVKPSVIYEEVKNSKIVIPNMPSYKTQDDLGECRAFALATIMQKYTCDQWKSDIPDCKYPPSDTAISYFGMMTYTHQTKDQSKTFQPDPSNARNMYDIVQDISNNGSRFILESCKPFDKLVNTFVLDKDGTEKKEKFFKYLQNLYQNRKSKTEANIADCPECLAEINQGTGLNANFKDLRKALTQESYDKFLYTLFFNGCEMESFPSGFSVRAYPDNSINATVADMKNKIKEGLLKGKPVLYSGVCLSENKGDECHLGHTLVISGFKKVCEPGSLTKCRDLVKLHNSLGAGWQKRNNDGWVDADTFIKNSDKVKSGSGYRYSSGSIIWLEP